jgi:antitoxin component YwqK of YwqJK toxin-antitoxin module
MRTKLFTLALLFASTSLLAQDQGYKREYYPGGQLSRISWAAGDEVRFVRYHENGQVMEKGAYVEGRPNGRWSQYDTSGERTCTARFDHGRRSGTWKLRTMDGITHHLVYKDNKLVYGDQVDASGTVVAERVEP